MGLFLSADPPRMTRPGPSTGRSLEHHRHRRDPGVRVPTEVHRRGRQTAVERGEVQEHERLDELAQIRGAHQPGDGLPRASARAIDDLAAAILSLLCQHDYTSL